MALRSPWNAEEDALLMQLLGTMTVVSFETWQSIKPQFPSRTLPAIRMRWTSLKLGTEAKRRKALNGEAKPLPAIRTRMQIPRDLPLPASLTALICGDPIPGRSALDIRMKNMNHRAASAGSASNGHPGI